MIRCEEQELQIQGSLPELLTEVTFIIRKLTNMYSREEVMSSIMSAEYIIPQNVGDKIDIEAGIKKFKNDTKVALEMIERVARADGETLEEKNISARKEHKKELEKVKKELHELLQEFATSIGAEIDDDILIDDDDEEDDDE